MTDLNEVFRIAAEERRNAQADLRASIAANVEAEAKKIEDDAGGSALRFVRADELRRTAAAIREGRL